MKNQVAVIRFLASREIQQRYITGGTRDEYLLPEELIESASTFVEDVIAGRCGHDLSDDQRKAIEEFGNVIRDCGAVAHSQIPNAELIENDPSWALIRESAKKILIVLAGISGSWSIDDDVPLP